MNFYLVGKYISGVDLSVVWDFAGIYDNEDMAINACISEEYFIMPVKLNEQLPDDRIINEGCYYPLLQDKPGTT